MSDENPSAMFPPPAVAPSSPVPPAGQHPVGQYAPPAAAPHPPAQHPVAPYASGQVPPYSPPPYPSAAYHAPSYAPRPTNGTAVASLVCGLAGLLLAWLVLPLLASVAAVITGHLALSQLKRSPEQGGKGMAVAGLVLGYAVVGIGLVTAILGLVMTAVSGFVLLPFLFQI